MCIRDSFRRAVARAGPHRDVERTVVAITAGLESGPRRREFDHGSGSERSQGVLDLRAAETLTVDVEVHECTEERIVRRKAEVDLRNLIAENPNPSEEIPTIGVGLSDEIHDLRPRHSVGVVLMGQERHVATRSTFALSQEDRATFVRKVDVPQTLGTRDEARRSAHFGGVELLQDGAIGARRAPDAQRLARARFLLREQRESFGRDGDVEDVWSAHVAHSRVESLPKGVEKGRNGTGFLTDGNHVLDERLRDATSTCLGSNANRRDARHGNGRTAHENREPEAERVPDELVVASLRKNGYLKLGERTEGLREKVPTPLFVPARIGEREGMNLDETIDFVGVGGTKSESLHSRRAAFDEPDRSATPEVVHPRVLSRIWVKRFAGNWAMFGADC